MNPVPTIVISDPEVLARLAAAEGPIILRGPKGECLRMAELVPPGKLPAGFKSPISDEEFEEARKQTGGRPLADILRDLKRKYGE
jgi:hypothetical protein